MMQARAIESLRWMKTRQGEPIYFLFNITRIRKRVRKMFAVSKIYDYKSRRFLRGHMVVTGAIMFRGIVLPWKFDLWVPNDEAGDGYRKTTQIAA